MHELGIVFHIIDSVETIGKENEISSVSKVTLELGEVSGVVESYLKDCWRWAADKSKILAGAELDVETIQAITFCEDCKKEYETVAHGRTCPHCGSEQTYLVTGNEINIKEIEAS